MELLPLQDGDVPDTINVEDLVASSTINPLHLLSMALKNCFYI